MGGRVRRADRAPASTTLWARTLQVWPRLTAFGVILVLFHLWKRKGEGLPAVLLLALAVTFVLALGWAALSRLDDTRIGKAAQRHDPASMLSMVAGGTLLPAQTAQCLRAVIACGPEAVPLLLRCLDRQATFPELTNPVARGLGKVARSTPALRAGAAYCLGELKERSAAAPLSQCLSDPDPDVRSAAAAALRRIDVAEESA